jgi:hypothetical protein
MKLEDFKNFKYMTPNDNWGDISKINKILAIYLELVRIKAGVPLTITSPAYAIDGHAKRSQHYFGCAADIRLKGKSIKDHWDIVKDIGFNGIGLYPNNGRPFIHVDVRNRHKVMWVATGESINWIYNYFTNENDEVFKKYIL